MRKLTDTDRQIIAEAIKLNPSQRETLIAVMEALTGPDQEDARPAWQRYPHELGDRTGAIIAALGLLLEHAANAPDLHWALRGADRLLALLYAEHNGDGAISGPEEDAA